MLLISTNGKTSLFDPHKFITNYLNTDLPTIPQSAPTKGERSKRQLNTISHRRQTYHINLVDQTHTYYCALADKQ